MNWNLIHVIAILHLPLPRRVCHHSRPALALLIRSLSRLDSQHSPSSIRTRSARASTSPLASEALPTCIDIGVLGSRILIWSFSCRGRDRNLPECQSYPGWRRCKYTESALAHSQSAIMEDLDKWSRARKRIYYLLYLSFSKNHLLDDLWDLQVAVYQISGGRGLKW